MTVKNFFQLFETLEQAHEFVTNVKANIFGGDKDVDIEDCLAKIHWSLDTTLHKDGFAFEVKASQVTVTCVYKTLDSEGEVETIENKTFTFTEDQIDTSDLNTVEVGSIVQPSEVNVYLSTQSVDVTW